MLNIKKHSSRACPAKLKRSGGFTLLEILLVVGIIAILAGIVIVAINPSRQLATVRNTERKADIKQIDSALTQYYIDNSHYPTSLTSTLTEVCDTGALASSSGQTTTCTNAGLINLSELVPTYLTAIPRDPSATTTSHAGYQIVLASNKIGLSAPAELNQVITIGTVPEVVVATYDEFTYNGHTYQINPTITTGKVWGPMDTVTGIQSTTDGAGNTTALALLGPTYEAATAVKALSDGGYTDWFLPAQDELVAALNEYKAQKPTNPTWGGFVADVSSWSSTEITPGADDIAGSAYYLGFADMVQSSSKPKNETDAMTRAFRIKI